MCIGIPMQVLAVESGYAQVTGGGETRRVCTRLLEQCAVGQWLLVFLDDAREHISAERAQEVNAVLELLRDAMGTTSGVGADSDPGFVLPSAMDAQALGALVRA
ncbi:MAG: HypC/HybG/HupF family hydrogenase formation chaperone [Burkholderiales bacterium]